MDKKTYNRDYARRTKHAAQAKYSAEKCVGKYLKFNIVHDADIIAKISEVDNLNGYIKKLIRSDIQQNI